MMAAVPTADVVVTNPPFGGKEKANIQENFPIKTGETAYLFLQHFIKKLKVGGRCGVVIKNTFLSNIDTARNQLVEVVEETLDNDITRNNNAIDTQIVDVSADEGVLFPIGAVRIVVRVLYEFTRGTA